MKTSIFKEKVKDFCKELSTCDVIAICLIFGILITLVYIYKTAGVGWLTLFYQDQMDTGMDFFHSIEYVKGRLPYEQFQTLYPPLANLFFYILFKFVPSYQYEQWNFFRGTPTDLRFWQPTMMLFILYIIISVIILFVLFQKLLEKYRMGTILSIALIVSFGIINAYERGNIILLVLMFVMFFIEFKDSDNKILSEFALISLAIAAGLKLYPAIFGFLLVYEKQWKKAIRTIIYGIIMFIAPFFAFYEGINGLPIFIKVLTTYYGTSTFSANGLSADRLVNSLIYSIDGIFGTSFASDKLMEVGTIINVCAVGLLLVAGFFLKKKWERVLVCSLAVLMYQSQFVYILTILIVALLCFLKEEDRITKENLVVIVGMVFTQMLIPLNFNASLVRCDQYFRLQIGVVLLLCYVVYKVIKEIVLYAKKSNLQESR